jgi:hypothetical protein
MVLNIYANPRRQAEKQYIFQVVFEEFLGIPYTLHWQDDLEETRLHVPPTGHWLLFPDTFYPETHASGFQAVSQILEGARVDHPFQQGEVLPMVAGRGQFRISDTELYCPIDIFAACYFMLSRWEELLTPARDAHGRFPLQAAHAHRHQYLHRPLADEYTDVLWQLLQRAGYAAPRRTRQFQVAPSHDVDHPRLWWRTAARLRTLAGSAAAPGRKRFSGCAGVIPIPSILLTN